jgi:hypothetical protein
MACIFWAASRCRSGTTWLYAFIVSAISECPVLVLSWWADDAPGLPDADARAAYAASLQIDYNTMLADLHLS